MTSNEIIAFFEKLIDDTIDSDFALDLANNAKDQRESEMMLKILEKIDSSESTAVGNTYETEIDLPTDFSVDKRVILDDREIFPIPFDEQIWYKDDQSKYFIDHGGKKLHICGTATKAETIHQIYIKFSPELTATTEPIWPDRFHKIIPFDMADLYFSGIDTDDVNRQMAPRQRFEAEKLRKAMLFWDATLKNKSHGKNIRNRKIGRGSQDNLPSNVVFR